VHLSQNLEASQIFTWPFCEYIKS